MGGTSSAAQPPIGGVLLPITWGTERPGVLASKVALIFTAAFERPAFRHQKAAQLEPALTDQAWATFREEVDGTAQAMWRNGFEMWALLIMAPVLCVYLSMPGGLVDRSQTNIAVLALLMIALLAVFSLRTLATSRNSALDQRVLAACDRLHTETRLLVDYRRRHTGFCKGRLTQAFRAVAISPGA